MRDTFTHSNAAGLSDGQVQMTVNGRTVVVKSTGEAGLPLEDGSLLVMAKSGATVLIREADGMTTSRYVYRAGAGWTLTRSRRVEKWTRIPVHPDSKGVADINGAKALSDGTFVIGSYTIPHRKRVNIRDDEYGNHFVANPNIDQHLYWKTPGGTIVLTFLGENTTIFRDFFWARWVQEIEEVVLHEDEKKTNPLATVVTVAVVAMLFIPFLFCIITPFLALTIRVAQEGFSDRVLDALTSLLTIVVLGVICWAVKRVWSAATALPDPKIPAWDEL